MADPRETARAWLAAVLVDAGCFVPEAEGYAEAILDAVSLDTEESFGRLVQCERETPQPVRGECPEGRSWSTFQGRHKHWTPYDTPHERVVIRLPAQPVSETP